MRRDNNDNYVDHEYPDIDPDAPNPWPANGARPVVTISRTDYDLLMAMSDGRKNSESVAIWVVFCAGAVCGGAAAGILSAILHYLGRGGQVNPGIGVLVAAWHWIGGM